MKRCGDSKAFIPLIIVFFILLAGMVMTGCVSTALTSAAYNGQTNIVKDLLDKGADPNERGSCFFPTDPLTPLSCAVLGGHMEAVKVLVDRGVDVNARISSVSNWTPLMLAVNRGHGNIARLLIEKGADVEGALARFKKIENSSGGILGVKKGDYEFLERLANKYQPPRQGTSPSTLPTALPLPTESKVPF